MIRYFKSFDIIRVLIYVLIAVLIRSLFINDKVVLVSAINWISVGDAISNGEVLYKTVWTTLEPFSAYFYTFINYLNFENPYLTLRIFSLIILLFQSVYFNHILNSNNVLHHKSALPGLFYILFGTMNFDLVSLSPIQLGMTFLLPVLNILFKNIKLGTKTDDHFIAGMLVGIASLFYFPFLIFILFVIFSLATYSSFDFKRAIQTIYGFFIPWLLILVVFYLNHNIENFMSNFIYGYFYINNLYYTSIESIIKLASISIILSIVSFVLLNRVHFLSNYQFAIIKIMSFWFLFAFGAFFLVKEWSYYLSFIWIPVFAFFSSYLFLMMKKWWLSELFFILLIMLLSLQFIHELSLDKKRAEQNESSFIVNKDYILRYNGEPIINKKIVIIGYNPIALKHNHNVSNIFTFGLVEDIYNDLNSYENISKIYAQLIDNKAEYIVDELGLMPILSIKIPALKTLYEPSSDMKIYKKNAQ
jgi:hypothetical protein